MTARVRSERHFATDSAVRQPVSGSTSAKTGTALHARTAMTVPKSVIGGTMTSSPGAGSTAATARCSAAVPEVLATACAAPT